MWHAYRTRLATLELQIAGLGELYAPAHMLVERDQLETELKMIERANEPRPSEELYSGVDQHIRDQAVMSAVMNLSGRVYEVQAGQRRSDEQLDRFQTRLMWLLPVCIVLVIVLVEVLARI